MPQVLPPCIIDIEASGFGRRSYPIEIGYVLPDGRARCMLIRPTTQWTHWDDEAAHVHGITRETLMTHGKSPHEVATILNADLAGMVAYCDGWAHDYTWLAALFEEADMAPRFKLESVNRLLGDTQLSQLDEARRGAMAELGLTRHRASNDARALQCALTRLGRLGGLGGPGGEPKPAPAPARAPAGGAT
jgi:DNA polymerase III epsilon subunit-like protein